MEKLVEHVRSDFESRFRKKPIFIASPGRINIIGEHTDYNGGLVLPAAIDKYIAGAFTVNHTTECTVRAVDFDKEFTFRLNKVEPEEKGSFANHILGVVHEIQKQGIQLGGFDLSFSGNIPQGAGLSSSAALGNCIVYGLNKLFQLDLSNEEMINIAVKAEHNFVGVECGIMDQFASMNGRKNHLILLDCATGKHDFIPVTLNEYQFVLLNSNVSHSLQDSEYNQRKEECIKGLKAIQKSHTQIKTFRDITIQNLDGIREEISEVMYKRCSYVIEENQRTLNMVEAYKNNQWETVGSLLYASHNGLQNKYEVSCPELDFLVEQTKDRSDVVGSRMMGGGFGGCTINLVKSNSITSFVDEMRELYTTKFNLRLSAYPVSIVNGTQQIRLSLRNVCVRGMFYMNSRR